MAMQTLQHVESVPLAILGKVGLSRKSIPRI